jgi:Tol biopolymer transport system component
MRNARWPIFAAAGLVLTAVFVVDALRPKARPPAPQFHQITFDPDGAGADSPALSPDGRFLAYCSFGSPGGKRNLRLQSVDGNSPPRRLTDGPSNDYDPAFSSDGAFVYFTSDREPNGIYRVSAAGGPAELVHENAVTPQFSPDGRSFLFNRGGVIYVTPASGGPAQALTAAGQNSYGPVWSPDSRSVLFATGSREGQPEWWIALAAGGEPYRSDVPALLARHGFNFTYARAWLPDNELVFAGRKGETMTLWRIGLTPDGRTVTHDPLPATDDPEGDYYASFAAGRLAVGGTRVGLNLWSLLVDKAGRVQSAPERLTATPNQKGGASLSADGRNLLFSEENDGAYSLFLRDLQSAKQREFLPGIFFSVLRPDGRQLAFARGPINDLDVLSRGTGWWWFSRTLCKGCGVPRGFSPDGASLLLWAATDTGDHVDLLDVSSRRLRPILTAPPRPSGISRFYSPQLSPDGRLLLFGLRSGEHDFESWIAPLHSDRPTPENEWSRVIEAGETYHIPFWSSDGSLVYILENHGGGNLKWLDAQPFDRTSLRLAGQRFIAYEFHEPRVPTMAPLWNPVMSAAGRILIELGDRSANIWIGSPATQPSAGRAKLSGVGFSNF